MALGQMGLDLHRVQVGDRYVTERLLAGTLDSGGREFRPHYLPDRTTTGDGIAALQVLTGDAALWKACMTFKAA